jgi:hypothetical protein
MRGAAEGGFFGGRIRCVFTFPELGVLDFLARFRIEGFWAMSFLLKKKAEEV